MVFTDTNSSRVQQVLLQRAETLVGVKWAQWQPGKRGVFLFCFVFHKEMQQSVDGCKMNYKEARKKKIPQK